MLPPGGLAEWPSAARDWEDTVTATLARIVARTGRPLPPSVSGATPANATEPRTTDWPAAPARVRACLGTAEADRVCDTRDPSAGDLGRLAFQEEYAEWRMVRDHAGAPLRFELTTELADYWLLLAEHAPRQAIQQVAEFARTDTETAAAMMFGTRNPLAASAGSRSATFATAMLGPQPGPLNNGLAAITCLTRDDNTLEALINLVTAAAGAPQRVVDPSSQTTRFASGSEAIERLREGSAQDCRHSDPVVVERIVRLATEGRHIRFDDPIGVYVLEVQTSDLLLPDDSPLPDEWCRLSRGGAAPGGGSLAQRVEIEIPPEAGFTLASLRSRRTGNPIVHGGQIAELVQLGVRVRCGPARTVDVAVETYRPAAPTACGERDDCAVVRSVAARLAAMVT